MKTLTSNTLILIIFICFAICPVESIANSCGKGEEINTVETFIDTYPDFVQLSKAIENKLKTINSYRAIKDFKENNGILKSRLNFYKSQWSHFFKKNTDSMFVNRIARADYLGMDTIETIYGFNASAEDKANYEKWKLRNIVESPTFKIASLQDYMDRFFALIETSNGMLPEAEKRIAAELENQQRQLDELKDAENQIDKKIAAEEELFREKQKQERSYRNRLNRLEQLQKQRSQVTESANNLRNKLREISLAGGESKEKRNNSNFSSKTSAETSTAREYSAEEKNDSTSILDWLKNVSHQLAPMISIVAFFIGLILIVFGKFRDGFKFLALCVLLFISWFLGLFVN